MKFPLLNWVIGKTMSCKAPALATAIAELKKEGICPPIVEHRQAKYLNNVIEGDHGRLKRILGPKGAFKNVDVCIPNAQGYGGDALDSRKGKGTMFDLTGIRTQMW